MEIVFKVYDEFKGYPICLGAFNTLEEARACVRQQVKYTDGECKCFIEKHTWEKVDEEDKEVEKSERGHR